MFDDASRNGGYFDSIATALPSDAIYVRRSPTVIGSDIALSGPDLLRDSSASAARDLILQEHRPGRGGSARYTLFRESRNGVYCLRRPSGPAGSSRQSSWLVINVASLADPISASSGGDPASVCNGEHFSRKAAEALPTIYLYGRSVDAIFQYLGRMLTYSPRERAIPFFIDSERPRDPRFHVDYRGKTYYVSENAMSCTEQDPSRGRLVGRDCSYGADAPVAERDRGDETLFVLSVLNQLLNLYKSASDIPVTPAVQAVP